MEHNKELKTFNFKAFLEKRRNKENGIQRKVDRISNDERMDKMITELSKEMDMQKRQLARMYTNNSDTDTVEDIKGEYRRTIKQTEHMMELDSLFGNSNMNLA